MIEVCIHIVEHSVRSNNNYTDTVQVCRLWGKQVKAANDYRVHRANDGQLNFFEKQFSWALVEYSHLCSQFKSRRFASVWLKKHLLRHCIAWWPLSSRCRCRLLDMLFFYRHADELISADYISTIVKNFVKTFLSNTLPCIYRRQFLAF